MAVTLVGIALLLLAHAGRSIAEQRIITFNDVEVQSGRGELLPGVEFVSEVFIASSASMDLDDIVLEMH